MQMILYFFAISANFAHLYTKKRAETLFLVCVLCGAHLLTHLERNDCITVNHTSPCSNTEAQIDQ